MNEDRLSMMKPTAVIMHPGPMNRGVEIDDATADGERSLILRQVANGVPVRMAVIAEALESSG
jgi:aspartate carbamoyltransferase catalytic subunit